MKTFLISLIILAVTIIMVLADALTIEIPAADVPRISEAFGATYNMGHNASINEVSDITRRWIIQQTQDYERRKNTPRPLEMQPTPTPIPTPAPTATATKVGSPQPTATPKKKGWW